MTRKSKQAGGSFPLTYYERNSKFASSDYGTTTKRLAGHSQYQLGDCALSLTRLSDAALCTPSGYLYSREAILEYLLTRTRELNEQQAAFERQRVQEAEASARADESKRLSEFTESQKMVKKRKAEDSSEHVARQKLKQTSYWLAESQPDAMPAKRVEQPPDRPQSPHSQEPLRRKDFWPLLLKWDDDAGRKKLVCQVSEKVIHTQAATAYWVDKKQPGTIVLTTVFDELIKDTMICPVSGRKIKHTRPLQQSGTSFASSGQKVEVKKYRPTIT